ncbi:hypothetical protein QTO34_019383 [Cnephaeus nilssonii]|uniref:Uncharacterized protein n=1 Tax=Cnephaeus nilssonii TaxID=3371016 RepID=A0AA40HWF5_CNENI|nr:hypothetical protein QTO34_019383 [Eptesicus nilssonii]
MGLWAAESLWAVGAERPVSLRELLVHGFVHRATSIIIKGQVSEQVWHNVPLPPKESSSINRICLRTNCWHNVPGKPKEVGIGDRMYLKTNYWHNVPVQPKESAVIDRICLENSHQQVLPILVGTVFTAKME